MSAPDDKAQVDKYEAWAAKLERNIVDMARQRAWSWAYLAGGAVVGAIVWRFHHFVGGSVFTLGVILWITAIYITYMRTWYYQNELARTRYELERLAEAAPAPASGRAPKTEEGAKAS
jgi:hypothetical protein